MKKRKPRTKKNKKGTISILPSKVGLYFATLIILSIGIGFFITIADRTFMQGVIAQPGAQQSISIYRFVNSPSCFAYVDPDINQVDAGLIDLTKFTQEQLDKCFVVGTSAIHKDCFKLTLYDFKFGKKKMIKEVQTKNFAMCHAEKAIVQYPFLVRIHDNGDVRRGLLFFESKKVT